MEAINIFYMSMQHFLKRSIIFPGSIVSTLLLLNKK